MTLVPFSHWTSTLIPFHGGWFPSLFSVAALGGGRKTYNAPWGKNRRREEEEERQRGRCGWHGCGCNWLHDEGDVWSFIRWRGSEHHYASDNHVTGFYTCRYENERSCDTSTPTYFKGTRGAGSYLSFDVFLIIQSHISNKISCHTFPRHSAKPLVISIRVHVLNVRGCHRDKLTWAPGCNRASWQPVQVVIVTLSTQLSLCAGFSDLWSEINFQTEVTHSPDPPPRRPPRRSWARSLGCPPSRRGAQTRGILPPSAPYSSASACTGKSPTAALRRHRKWLKITSSADQGSL